MGNTPSYMAHGLMIPSTHKQDDQLLQLSNNLYLDLASTPKVNYSWQEFSYSRIFIRWIFFSLFQINS